MNIVKSDGLASAILLLQRLVDWALGEEVKEVDDTEPVLVFVIRTSASRIRVGGRPGESIADLLARVVRLAMMPEHGGLAGASVRVCTAAGQALAAGTLLLELKSQELVLAEDVSDDKGSFDVNGNQFCADYINECGTKDKVESGVLQSDDQSEPALATSFIRDPDLGPAVLISTTGSRPRAGSETLHCNLQF